MVQSLRELGHFGGWSDKGIVDNTAAAVEWGDPMVRNVEITPTDDLSNSNHVFLKLPQTSRVTIGAEYNIFVFNDAVETTGRLEVQDFDGTTIVRPDTVDLVVIPAVSGGGDMVTLIFDGTDWVLSNPYDTVLGTADHAASYSVPTNSGSWPLTSDVVNLYQNVSNMNAKTIADAHGYNGQDNYRIVIRCHSMIIGSSYPLQPAFTTGEGWGTGCSVHLELINSTVAGWGGEGGSTLNVAVPVEFAPGDGGDALHAYTDLLVIADDTSRVTPGSGGGPSNSTTAYASGGGGGNGGNMTVAGAIINSLGGPVQEGGGVSGGAAGQPGSLVEGGNGGGGSADDGGDWGEGVTGSTESSVAGKTARAEGATPINWSASSGFRWGNNGTPTSPPTYPATIGDL